MLIDFSENISNSGLDFDEQKLVEERPEDSRKTSVKVQNFKEAIYNNE